MIKLPLHHIIFGFFFFLLVTFDIYLGSTTYVFFRIISKPLILLTLIFYFLQNRVGMEQRPARYALMALVFSLMGDVFLLFDKISELYFILGLGSFLLAHVCYAFTFYLQRFSKIRSDFWVTTLLFLSYGSVLFIILQPYLGSLKIPVALYIIAILIMVITAYSRKGNVKVSSFLLVFIGAISFIISDSLLAINKFLIPLPYSNFLVMGTYALAQYLIVRGLIKYTDGNSD
tara:strand:+ start:917 stop:1609 length:693 start_codon:yes stop_codon:yes gene_type:complete